MKAALVSTASLARLAEGLDLGQHLLLGRGEEKTGGRRKQALLADGYEALIAAIYLDGGVEQVTAFIARQFEALINEARDARGLVSRLQVRAAGARAVGAAIRCPNTRSSARRARIITNCFRCRCAWAASRWRKPSGRSKKEAEQEAARLALSRF